jgi:hypothetical protein
LIFLDEICQSTRQSGSSRTAIYSHAQRVVQAVANEQASGISYEELWAENERLRSDNEALWQAWSEAEELSEAKQRELASAGSALGLSLSQIVVLLRILLPLGRVPSRATVGRWVQHTQRQSRYILEVLDRACQRLVLVVCLDEIFFHREPILMGVEPISLAWLVGQDGDTLDITPAMMRVTLAIAAKTLLDADVEDEATAIGGAITTLLRLSPRLTMPLAPLLRRLPLPSQRHLRRAEDYLDTLIYRLIDARRTTGGETDDVLSMLVDAQTDDGSPLSPRQIHDEALIII